MLSLSHYLNEMAFIYSAETLLVVKQIAHIKGETRVLIFNSATQSPPKKRRSGPGKWLHKLEAAWKDLAMEWHHHLAAQVLLVAERHWQLLGMLLILQACACALGCLYNWSKMLNLSLSVSELTPNAVCWQMLTHNA